MARKLILGAAFALFVATPAWAQHDPSCSAVQIQQARDLAATVHRGSARKPPYGFTWAGDRLVCAGFWAGAGGGPFGGASSAAPALSGGQSCSAFSTCAEARSAYAAGNTSLDGDGDGIPCEELCQ